MSQLAALTLSVLLASGAPCERTVVEGRQYGVPGSSNSIITIDADRDGRPDLVAGLADRNAVAVLRNRGDGFAAVTTVALPHPANAVTLADVNGDSRDEVLAVGPQHLSTLFSNGDGTFRVVSNAFSGAALLLNLDRLVATGDVTGDGKLDFAGISSGALRVFAGEGDGTFTHLASPAMPRSVSMINVAELTGDAKADVLLGDTEEAALLPSNGDGTFGERRVLSRTGRERTVLARDMDGDGRADMMTFSDLAAARLLFLSSRNYESPQQHDLPGWSRIADFDGDGDVDFISGLQSYRTNSDGTHTPVWRGGGGVASLTSGDYDGDGRLDLALPMASFNVAIRRGRGDLTFEGSQHYTHPGDVSEIFTGDFDGDGRADVLSSNTGAITLYFGNADGTLRPGGTLGVFGAGTAVAADFTGDGRIDLFTSRGVIPRTAAGTFDVGAAIALPPNLVLRHATMIDRNEDGKLDLIAINASTSGTPAELVTLTGDGTGRFAISFTPAAHIPTAIQVADVTGDGKPDILTYGRESEGRWTIRLWTGGSSVIVAEGVGEGHRVAMTLAVGDVDGDGELDLVAPGASKRELLLFRGNGNGTFVQTQRIPIEGPERTTLFSGVALADMTGDGRPDIIVTAEWFRLSLDDFENTSVLKQLADGTFTEAARLHDGFVYGAVVADTNGDGFGDLLIPSFNGFSLHLSQCRTAPTVRLLVDPTSPQGTQVVLSAVLDIAEATGNVMLVEEVPEGVARTIATAPVVAGRATFATNALARGTHRLKAIYSGEGAYTYALSGMVEHTVTEPPPSGPRRRSARH